MRGRRAQKCCARSPRLDLQTFLEFAQQHLPPPPYNRGILGGDLRDKSYETTPQQQSNQLLPRLESFFGNEFEGIHLYMSADLYLLSSDLVDFVVSEVPHSTTRVAPGGYVIGEEGHDVASMAFHSPTPLQVIVIPKSQQFWSIV